MIHHTIKHRPQWRNALLDWECSHHPMHHSANKECSQLWAGSPRKHQTSQMCMPPSSLAAQKAYFRADAVVYTRTWQDSYVHFPYCYFSSPQPRRQQQCLSTGKTLAHPIAPAQAMISPVAISRPVQASAINHLSTPSP